MLAKKIKRGGRTRYPIRWRERPKGKRKTNGGKETRRQNGKQRENPGADGMGNN